MSLSSIVALASSMLIERFLITTTSKSREAVSPPRVAVAVIVTAVLASGRVTLPLEFITLRLEVVQLIYASATSSTLVGKVKSSDT